RGARDRSSFPTQFHCDYMSHSVPMRDGCLAADFDRTMTVEPDAQSASPPGHEARGDPACRVADEEAPPQSSKAGNYAGLLAVTAMASGLLLGVLLAGSFGIGGDVRAGGGSL